MNEQPIYVVVTQYDGPPRKDGTRNSGLVMETEINGATIEMARQKAAIMEVHHGACRIARLEFVDVNGEPL